MKVLFFILALSGFVWSNIGNVAALKGDANIVRQGKTLNVKSGMALKVKDTIKTSSKARVQVILKDDTVVTIGPDSSFVFDAYTFGTKENSHVAMHIDRGFFRSVTGKIGKLAPERFKVKTASATIGIRGTDFSALVSENQEIISCYSGKITALIDNISHNVVAGMELDNTGGKITKRALS
ncbi:MAG: FecR family protein, partial [Sulfurovum sp.]|nr:FecR family protein [Sulfurovum sp.]